VGGGYAVFACDQQERWGSVAAEGRSYRKDLLMRRLGIVALAVCEALCVAAASWDKTELN
jgi:hypothetical protein